MDAEYRAVLVMRTSKGSIINQITGCCLQLPLGTVKTGYSGRAALNEVERI